MVLAKQRSDVIWNRYNFPVSMENCVLYLPFWQEDTRISPFLSYDKYAYSCTVTEATWGSQGRTFDGVDDKIVTTLQAQLDGSAWTLIFWAKPSTITVTSRYLATTATNVPSGGIWIRQRVPGGFDVLVHTNSTDNLYSGRIGSDNTWNCYAFVYDNSLTLTNKLRGYLDAVDSAGNSAESGTFNGMTNSPEPLTFGTFANGGAGTFMDAILGEFWAFNKAVSVGFIRQVMQATEWRYK